MPTNLTAADLDALLTYWRDLHEKASRPGSGMAPYITGRAVEEITALIAAIREARALVEALVEYEPATWGGVDGDECYWCDRLIPRHAPDCAWDAARKALDAWKGGGDE